MRKRDDPIFQDTATLEQPVKVEAGFSANFQTELL